MNSLKTRRIAPTKKHGDSNNGLLGHWDQGFSHRSQNIGVGIRKYLDTNELPTDKEEALNVKNRAACFMVIDGVLYKRGFSKPLLRYISQYEA